MVKKLTGIHFVVVLWVLLVGFTSGFGFEKKAYRMREDFGAEPAYDGCLQYYYYIPCPTYSWFWGYSGWVPGDIVGQGFVIGDQGTGGYDPLDSYNCNSLEQTRVLDFAGYGIYYPGLFTIEFDVYCASEAHVHLYNSGPWETHFGWNYIRIDPPLCFTQCWVEGGCCPGPRIVVTATCTGTNGILPSWGMDNISSHIRGGCELHDIGCGPVFYPRGAAGVCPGGVHGGYFGTYPFQYSPPLGFLDGNDTTHDGRQYGFIELAWTIYIHCQGPTAAEPISWSSIKTMYR